jgi:4a-hydroxytetrahydrobiopterin dehydratase
MTEQITAGQFHAADGVEDWRRLHHLVSAHFRTGSLATGIALVDEIGRLADGVEQQYLTIDLRSAGVTVSLGRRDIAFARRISAAAKELDIPADPRAVQLVNVTLDVLVGADVPPFWRALLGYGQIGDDYLFDPSRRGPGFELQQMDAARPQRNRMHLDVAVPHDQAEARVAAALAAGGHLVSDVHAPMWWVLADGEGNEACVATWSAANSRHAGTVPPPAHTATRWSPHTFPAAQGGPELAVPRFLVRCVVG